MAAGRNSETHPHLSIKLIDPPEGWKYGFPKQLPDNVENIIDWLIRNGYPKQLIESYGDSFYYRIIE